jgi:hypothetical protein
MSIRSLVSLLLISLCFCALLQATEPTGTIAGSISDPSGAAVPNAKATATALATGTRTHNHEWKRWSIRDPLVAGCTL